MKKQIVTVAVAQASNYLRQHPETAQRAVHVAADFANKRTGGKYATKIAKAEQAADRYFEKQRSSQVPGTSQTQQPGQPGTSSQFRQPE